MYGTTEFAIDRNMGQLYTIRYIDVTPINLFGVIPDEDLDGQTAESTLVPPKTPQAMSTPVTEVPRSLENATVPPDSVPLPTHRMPTRHQEEEMWTSSSTLSDPSVPSPHFNVNRANVRAASSVSSLEGEGIVNDDAYERPICRIQKINWKLTTLIKNWNEESESGKTPKELVEIDTFYRTYMGQYNARQKTLERLMEIYVEYYKDVTLLETPQPESLSGQTIPRTTHDQTVERMSAGKRDPEVRVPIPNETHPKQEQTEEKHPLTPSHAQTMPTTMMRSAAHAVTQPIPSLRLHLRTMKGTSDTIGTTSQGRLSTLSSVVRPTPTIATRTMAITQEDSRLDALVTV